MKNSKFFFLALLASSLFFTSCDDDDNSGPVNDPEVITTVELTFTADGSSATYTVTDPDGDGGNAPVAETIQLEAGTIYTISTRFLDESDASDVENITEEVEEEADEHLVCFTTTGDLSAPAIIDTDSAGDPLGLTATVATTDAGSATLMVVLKHQPEKDSATPCSTGDTDVEVTFPVEIQ